MPDYVDASSGWLFPKGEVGAIERLIEDGLNNPGLFSKLRAGARKKALEFSWERVSSQVSEVYKIAASRNKADRVPGRLDNF